MLRSSLVTLFALFAILALAPVAHANTYLFSFTGSEILAGLADKQGEFTRSAYFEIFLQPDPALHASYSYTPGSIAGPTPSPANAWDATTITDPSNPLLGYDGGDLACAHNCTWVRFGKEFGQTSVSVLTSASFFNSGDVSWSSGGAFPYAWGLTPATVAAGSAGLVSPSSTFQFEVTTADVLSGNVKVYGYASALISTSSTSWTGAKETDNLPFTLTMSLPAVPEPSTWSLLLGPAVALWIRRRSQSKRPASSDPSHS